MATGLSGILNVDKPAGLTSHDVVAAVRRISGQRSVGHAGTLDPLATGVLIVLLGKATALASYAMASSKTYAAEVVLGAATDTDDAEGRIIKQAPSQPFRKDQIEQVLSSFVGECWQMPPTYSAIKHSGTAAYKSARAGKAVDRAPRQVMIRSIDLLEYSYPRLRIRVMTGPGTYIRSLARDIGEALNSAAYLHTLVRMSSGQHRLADAVSLQDLQAGGLEANLLPMDCALESYPAVFLNASDTDHARHGRPVPKYQDGDQELDVPVRLYGADGQFLGLARSSDDAWKPYRILDPAS